MRRLVPMLLLLATSGCVYFNGVYNAKSAARSGDSQLARGSDVEASAFFQTSAEKAETVLVRYPESRWRTEALYLAGRGAAFGGNCDLAFVRLNEYLERDDSQAQERNRARLALGMCDVRSGRVESARARLDSLLDVPEAGIAGQARLWAARAALAAGDRDAVAVYLKGAADGVLSWELIQSSLSAKEFVRAESLLVQRAQQADYRDITTRAFRDLWAAGEYDAVESIVQAYDLARVRDVNRAAMHFQVGELNLRSGRDTTAREHFQMAKTLASQDTVLYRESTARMAFMGLSTVTSLRGLDSIFSAQDAGVLRTPYAQRINEQVLLVRLLADAAEPTGASLFLAAEVARDSLHADSLARNLFLDVARKVPGAPMAPQALYAAGMLLPDSADRWTEDIKRNYANSAVAAWLEGDDPAQRADFVTTPRLMQLRWTQALRVWTDSVRKLRAAPRQLGIPPQQPQR